MDQPRRLDLTCAQHKKRAKRRRADIRRELACKLFQDLGQNVRGSLRNSLFFLRLWPELIRLLAPSSQVQRCELIQYRFVGLTALKSCLTVGFVRTGLDMVVGRRHPLVVGCRANRCVDCPCLSGLHLDGCVFVSVVEDKKVF